MENCQKQARLQSNRIILLKLKQAQHCLQQVINIFQSDPINLEVMKRSQRTQDLLKEVCDLIASNHLNHCVAVLIKKGEIENA
ncbi:MAG: hypothetical protein M1308_08500, partial [Actinobacteria bacterium]|nr:hypothetical protein [Actinomycetota bacterium]